MGTFTWPLRISSIDGEQSLEIEAAVDTGAFYTTLPASLLRELGATPMGKRRFLLADGRRLEMDYGEARAAVDGDSVTTLMVFGEDNAPALLGAYTLDGLGPGGGPGGTEIGPNPPHHVLGPVDDRRGADFCEAGYSYSRGSSECGSDRSTVVAMKCPATVNHGNHPTNAVAR